jgi:hypothetical protein
MNWLPRVVDTLNEVGEILENGFVVLGEEDLFKEFDYLDAVLLGQIVQCEVALGLNQSLDELNVVRHALLLQLLHRLQ